MIFFFNYPSGLSSGDVVGIVFGVIIGLAVVAAAGIFGYIYWWKPRQAAGGGGGGGGGGLSSTDSGKDTQAFAFSNNMYTDQKEDPDV